MQEDLLQAIFLHYIGVKWSEFFKKAFTDFRADSWKSTADISRIDRKYPGSVFTKHVHNLTRFRSSPRVLSWS
jgi:hypothetical protein